MRVSPWGRFLLAALLAVFLVRADAGVIADRGETPVATASLAQPTPQPQSVLLHHPMQPDLDAFGNAARGVRHEFRSNNWSGYYVAQPYTGQYYQSIKGNWTVPTAAYNTASSGTGLRQLSSTWVGIGAACDPNCTDKTLIQIGTEQDATLFGGTYYAWYELLPAGTVILSYDVQPGDQITASMQCTSSCVPSATQTWTLSINDLTQGWSITRSVTYASSMETAEWIEEAPSSCTLGTNCKVQALADFSTVTWGGVTANGVNPALSFGPNGIVMTQTAGPAAQPSTPVGGNAFTTCWGEGFPPDCGYTPTSPLLAAVLPASRSVAVGKTATIFATMINTGATVAQNCSVSLPSNFSGTFTYQTTDSATNAPTGFPNMPVNVPAGGVQTFVLSMTPYFSFAAKDLGLVFDCNGVGAAPIQTGLDTWLLASSFTATPDVVAESATVGGNGIVDIPGAAGTGAFAIATVNVGAASVGNLIVTANTGSASLPLTLTLCQTDPVSGQCLGPQAASVSAAFAANATPTFAVFAQATGPIPFDPAGSRIFVQIKDDAGDVYGETSVAVRTQQSGS